MLADASQRKQPRSVLVNTSDDLNRLAKRPTAEQLLRKVTLLTPKESRPTLAWDIPIRPLAEIVRDRSVGLVCFLGALNHGLVYLRLSAAR